MKNFEFFLKKTNEIGYIEALNRSVAVAKGLPGLKLGETIITQNNEIGFVIGMEGEFIEILMIETEKISGKEKITRTDQFFTIPINKFLLGRIVDPLCSPLDSLPPITYDERDYFPAWRKAPNITERIKIKRFLETGIMVIDVLVPIGYGQRELIIGDRTTGKTKFLLQTIVNQSKKGKICIYVAIGKSRNEVKNAEWHLKTNALFENIVIVSAFPDFPPPLIFLAPYAGMTIAEYFRDLGNDVLLILDEMTTHAKIYREISILLNRPPGKSAYPGDIFHIHAELMERAGNIRIDNGKEASITALPVAQTLENDLSGYIQTNLMAMTDGHILFDIKELQKGNIPPVNAFLSVSRVGNQTKTQVEREIADIVQKKLMEFKKALEVTIFGTELPEKTKGVIQLGENLKMILNQKLEILISREMQIYILGLLIFGSWRNKSLEETQKELSELLNKYSKGHLVKIEKEITKIDDLRKLEKLISSQNYEQL